MACLKARQERKKAYENAETRDEAGFHCHAGPVALSPVLFLWRCGWKRSFAEAGQQGANADSSGEQGGTNASSDAPCDANGDAAS